MSQLQLFRLLVGDPTQWDEQMGDPITNLGGAAVPAPRSALRHAVSLPTLAADGGTDTVTARLIIRRQMRSILNNTDLKLQGYLYAQYSDDLEQNGWYVPDQGSLTSGDGSSGLATGWWNLSSVAWMLAGHKRTHREARNIWMKDLRTGLYWRDALKWILSTDFAALTGLQISFLPSGATSAINTVTTSPMIPVSMPTGRDGGVCSLVTGQVDLSTISFERPETAFGLSDVIVYDRNGLGTAQSTYKAAVTLDAPIGWWRFDETTGTVANDSSALSNNDGTYVTGFTLNQTPGALTGSGDSDACVLLNGTSGYINVPDSTSLQITSSMTMEAWVKPTAFAAQQTVMSKAPAYSMFILTSAQISVGIRGTSNTFTPTITAGVWTHLVAVYNQTAGTCTLYINGVGTTATGFPTSGLTGSPGTALTFSASGGAWFGGDIDEFAVYNYALTANQAAGHYGLGTTTLSAGGDPQLYDGWSEVYGPDWPWSWQVSPTTFNDTPVLDNGLVRVRYDGTNGPGFRVDVWTGSLYVEQGKMLVAREGDSGGFCNTFVSAALHTDGGYTPDRATMAVVLANSADTSSRERIFVTVERGSLSVTFEGYPALKFASTNADLDFVWQPAPNSGVADLNGSVFKNDSATDVTTAGTGKNHASAGTGAGTGNSGLQGTAATLGNANFTTSANWVAMLRCPTTYNGVGAYQVNFSVLQAANAYVQSFGGTWSGGFGYGINNNGYQFFSQNGAGYMQLQVGFAATVADQILEAELMTLGTNTVTAVDAAASGTGSNTTTSTRTTDANLHVSRATWPNSNSAVYRVFARVKVSANTGSFYVKTGSTTGTTVTSASTTYVWLDLGEVTAAATTLEIHAWIASGGTVSVDRIEAILTQDRLRTGAYYSGCRDMAQAALYDSRQLGAVVSR